MHLLRTVAAAAFVAVLCAPVVGWAQSETSTTDSDPDVINFTASNMSFLQGQRVSATVGEIVKVRIEDEDPRRRWELQYDYSGPIGEGVVPTILPLVVGSGTEAPKTASEGDRLAGELKKSASELLALAREFLTASSVTKEDLARLQAMAAQVQKLKNEFGAQKPPPPADSDAIHLATQSLAAAKTISDWCAKTPDIREHAFPVRKGFRQVTVRACYQQLEISDANLVAETKLTCSRSTYELAVVESASGPRVTAGVLIPIFGKKPRDYYLDAANGGALAAARRSSPTGDPEAAVFVSARIQHKNTPWGYGPEVGLGIGSRMGQLYSLGFTVDGWGVGVGVGAALDTKGTREAIPGATTGSALERTQSSALVSWYIRFGFSSELWDAVSRATATGGAANVPQRIPLPANSTGQPLSKK